MKFAQWIIQESSHDIRQWVLQLLDPKRPADEFNDVKFMSDMLEEMNHPAANIFKVALQHEMTKKSRLSQYDQLLKAYEQSLGIVRNDAIKVSRKLAGKGDGQPPLNRLQLVVWNRHKSGKVVPQYLGLYGSYRSANVEQYEIQYDNVIDAVTNQNYSGRTKNGSCNRIFRRGNESVGGSQFHMDQLPTDELILILMYLIRSSIRQ